MKRGIARSSTVGVHRFSVADLPVRRTTSCAFDIADETNSSGSVEETLRPVFWGSDVFDPSRTDLLLNSVRS
jgi:hypothetical protein